MSSRLEIDLVTLDAKNDEFVLYLVEDGPWPNGASAWSETLARIQNRIFDAIDGIVDGIVADQFPESKGKKFVSKLIHRMEFRINFAI